MLCIFNYSVLQWEQSCETVSPSARHFGSGAVEAEGGGMLSVSKGRQINTTKHFGGGVNVSAGATLLIKAGALSLTNSYTPHSQGQI